jgi:serine phosphatase RsbU (regulator of sigma subunit)
MRLSRKQGLGRLALALGVAIAVAPATACAAGLLKIEVSPSPTVEVPGVLTVQTPAIPGVSVPAPTTVEVPSPPPTSTLPTSTLPTATAPVAESVKTTPPSSEAKSDSQPATETSTAANGASTNGASATVAGSTEPRPRSSTPSAARSARSSPARARARRRGAAVGSSEGRSLTAGSRARAPATSPASSMAHATGSAPSHEPSSTNPLDALGRHLPVPLPVPDWSKPIILLLLLVAIAFAVRSQLAARRARRLERQRATLLRDLGAMQAALVPTIPERLGELSVSVAYEPADGPAAGGDFYDLFELGPGKVAIVLGDVAGHGHEALDQAALTRYTLRAYLQAGLEPRAALALASSVLTQPGAKRFATVVIAVHDSASGRLTYASAGHPPPISVGFETPEPVTICNSAPICCDLPTGHRQSTISLPANGRVCFFSDGLVEARVAGEELLGRERLIELTTEPTAPRTAAELLERVRAAAVATPDDMVACIVSPATRVPPGANPVEELEVDSQTLSGPRPAMFLGACGVEEHALHALLARATEIARAEGKALLRVEYTSRDTATATVHAGLSAPAWADGLRAPLPA